MKPLDAVRAAAAQLAAAGVPGPRADAELLVGHVVGRTRSEIAVATPLDAAQRAELERLVERRTARVPLQHVLGEWGFRRLTLATDGRALVPRPETEVVVERALARIHGVSAPRVLDVGTGSGAIALALLDEHEGARVTAVDVSAGAVALARENAERTGLADRLDLVVGDLLAGAAGPFDLVVSNPPYVDEEALASLEPEVRDHDPTQALVAPGFTERIAAAARDVLGAGGWLVLECGEGEGCRVGHRLAGLGYEDVTITPDLAGIDRVVEGRRS
ncbi:MAG TPA: peptide chain release factor N(5)-glutamine methyltransferase [Gaiellaceae bacterium]|nr:peptide chain release factor N(5)-glutamine methyltransferase [Gaiellaceae bacterium]